MSISGQTRRKEGFWPPPNTSGMRTRGIIIAIVAVTVLVQPPVKASEPGWWSGWSMSDPRLSQPIYTETIVESLPIVAGDGASLDAKVLRPVVPAGTRVPAVMQLSPYFNQDIVPASILPELQKHKYVQRGYALVAVSLRGFGGSAGCPDYQGARDRADIDAIIDAIANAGWSNGNVGAIGLSWDGTSLNSAAVNGNPSLKTIVPAAAITDWYKWTFMHGVPAWYYGYNFNIYAPPVLWAGTGKGIPPQHAAGRACPALADSIVAQEHAAFTGLRSPWWDERDLVRLVDQVNPDLAVLQIQGGRDDGVRPDNLHEWDSALRERLPNYRLIVGDWTHLWPDTPNLPAASNPELEFNKYPLRSWSVLLLRWFDKWLKGVETGIMQMPPALLQDDKGNWHAEDGLHPSRGQAVALYPTAGGTLAESPQQGTLSFLDSGGGVDPRGTCVYAAIGLLLGCAPVKQPTGQFFTTAEFDEATRFSGIAKAHLTMTHSMPRGHVGVTFYDVNGSVWTPMTYGIASFNVRNGEHEYQPVMPGESFEQTVEIIARDFVLPGGHRLGIAIGSQVGRNPKGLIGNGYGPVPSGGSTDLHLGPSTWIEISMLTGQTPVLPIP